MTGLTGASADTAGLSGFGAATRAWFTGSFGAPTRVQRDGWPAIARGEHVLLTAPTGSGKTLAAFLAAIDRLTLLPHDAPEAVRVLYVSPLKALVADVERNLRAPLAGIHNARPAGATLRDVRVDVRTGDTPSRARRAQLQHPADILVTTPESLALLLTSRARETLRQVSTVIVDEIHVMAGSKRGVHLALTLERLAAITGTDPQRIGLSATQNPLSLVARYLGGDRPVTIVDAGEAPRITLRVEMPASLPVPSDGESTPFATDKPDKPDKPRRRRGPLLNGGGTPLPPRGGPHGDEAERGAWPAVIARTLELILAHRSTIVFVNSRLLCERLAQKLNTRAGLPAGQELVLAHHGSMSHERRHDVEELLKRGALRGLVATSSLELGIDMGAVDLVVLIESPGSASRGLQRIGRAGHSVGAQSVGHVFPKFRGDLLECAVVSRHMRMGQIEALRMPRACLDVLAQHIVAMAAQEPWTVTDLMRVVRRAAPFAELSGDLFVAVLDMLSGRFPSEGFGDLSARIVWDRHTDTIRGRSGALALAVMNNGTIPDRGTYGVHLISDSPQGGTRIGELDEEMVYESRVGEAVVLGASTWKIEKIGHDRVLVSAAPGEVGKLPFWRGDRQGRPVELGRAVGAWLRSQRGRAAQAVERDLLDEGMLEAGAARALAGYLEEQQRATNTLPGDDAITVESFRDELGDWRVCILTPLGSRVHAPWALALEGRLSLKEGWKVPVMWSDDGIALRLPESDTPPDPSVFFPDPEEIEDMVVDELRHSTLFAARFRENAARALLLPKRGFKSRTPLWLQRQRSQALLAEAVQHPRFPVVLETYRECLQDVFDLPALTELLSAVRQRMVRIDVVNTPRPSPFAQDLAFQYVATYLYDTDAPASERRVQALQVDRMLLRELLGHTDMRALLDGPSIDTLERELQHLDADGKCRNADQLHDMLRRLGDLREDEVQLRCDSGCRTWLDLLERERRACRVRIAGEERLIAVEDAARYRDGLGVAPPPGLPLAWLQKADAPLEGLLRRYARTHGPFTLAEVARRFGILPAHLEPVAKDLVTRGLCVEGELRPGGVGPELCDAEILRRIKRRTLSKLRQDVAPVSTEAYARFLLGWQGVGSTAGGMRRLEEIVGQLQGVGLPFSALEQDILPSRMTGFTSALLDELGALGGVVWVGRGALSGNDGKIALYHRDQARTLLAHGTNQSTSTSQGHDLNDTAMGLDAPHRAVLAHLAQRGASFLVEIQRAAQVASVSDTLEVLWDLAWRGLVTNDTFQALRGLSRRTHARRGMAAVGGRWSLVRDIWAMDSVTTHEQTSHSLALAMSLLERWGVVSRNMALADDIPGGFAALYPVLRTLEEAGKVRRGHFVDGLDGAQFALPGVLDRLRARPDDKQGVVVLATTDPACPWGSVLPWPSLAHPGAPRPRRVVGASLVVVCGRPTLYLEKGGRSIMTFGSGLSDDDDMARAVTALQHKLDYKSLRIARVDGGDVAHSAAAPRLVNAGFMREGNMLLLTRDRKP